MVEQVGKCPRCGAEVKRKPGRGRPAIWCSQACRRAASSERLAASEHAEPVQVVEVIREREVLVNREVEVIVEQPVSLDQAVQRVLTSPVATRKVLDGLSEQIAAGQLPHHAKAQLAGAMVRISQAIKDMPG